MKKNNTKTRKQNERRRKNQQRRQSKKGKEQGPLAHIGKEIPEWTVGVDLGDEESFYCVLDQEGEVAVEGSLRMGNVEMAEFFQLLPGHSRVVMEVGTHSPWVSRMGKQAGHEVVVANARRVKLITESSRKDDRIDAETLARLGRAEVRLLSPIEHRGKQAQADLLLIRNRAALVRARTGLVNAVRGLVKSQGERLPKCATEKVNVTLAAGLSEDLQQRLKPLLEGISALSRSIGEYDRQLERLAAERYPETERLKKVRGVGTLTALAFILVLEHPSRFRRSRQVGAYLGLRPGRRDSGQSRPQLRISKEGDTYLRSLLVEAAHCILRRRAPDSDLKRFGLKLSQRGGKNGRKRAKVAVARKLAVLLHRLWATGEVYDPLYNQKKLKPADQPAA